MEERLCIFIFYDHLLSVHEKGGFSSGFLDDDEKAGQVFVAAIPQLQYRESPKQDP